LRIYITSSGKRPFSEWLSALSVETRAVVRNRLDRIGLGNFGDAKSLGDGLYELRIDFGPGYRVYYGLDGKKIVLIVSSGDKSTQHKDIKLAKRHWNEYKENPAS
jgi:putative addiction module killer protein